MSKRSKKKPHDIQSEEIEYLGEVDRESTSTFEFDAIANGIREAGLILIDSNIGSAADRLVVAADHLDMLGFYRDSFPFVAEEFRANASAIENRNSTFGFEIFSSLMNVPPRSLAAKVLEAMPDAGDMESVSKDYDALIDSTMGVKNALHELDNTINLNSGFPSSGLGSEISILESKQNGNVLIEAATVMLGSSLLKFEQQFMPLVWLLSMFNFFGICPKDECTEEGMVRCSLDSVRIHVPVRQFSQYATSDSFKLGDGKAADVIDGLTDRLLEFAKTGKLPVDAVTALTALLSGAGLKGIVEKWLKGKIGIDAVVAWIMARIGPALSTATAGVLAAVIFMSLLMVTLTIAVAKIYTKVITQKVNQGALICAKINYTLCVEGWCHKYLVNKSINLRITPRSVEVFDAGTDLWLGGQLGNYTAQDLIIYQYLLDLIARLEAEVAKESDPAKKLELQAKKLAAESELKKMKNVKKFMKELKNRISAKACAALKDGQDEKSLESHNFYLCG